MISLRKCFLILLLFSAALSLLHSQSSELNEMTNEEIYKELIQNLEERKNLITEKEQILTEKEERLNQRESDYLMNVKKLETREQLLIERENSLNVMKNYWQSLKEDQNNDFLNGFLIGAGSGLFLGFTGGSYAGFKIGISISLH